MFGAQKYIKIDTDMKENEREEMYEELIKEILYAAGNFFLKKVFDKKFSVCSFSGTHFYQQ